MWALVHFFLALALMANVLPEILIAIFTESLVDTAELYDTRHSPWLPAQVCRSWRAVAHQTPELWSKLELHRAEVHHLDHIRFCLKTSLVRSRDRPLHIQLFDRQEGTSGSDTGLVLFLQMLWPHRARWETFGLGFPEVRFGLDRSELRQWLEQANREACRSMPILRNLSLRPDDSLKTGEIDILLSLFRDTAALEKLGIHEMPGSKPFLANLMPVTDTQRPLQRPLRTVSLKNCAGFQRPANFHQLHLLCKDVTVLRIVSETSDESPSHLTNTNQCYTFPNLQSLSVWDLHEDALLSSINSPQLAALETSANYGEDLPHALTARRGSEPGIGGIDHLIIRLNSVRAEAIHALPTLRVLDLRFVSTTVASAFLQAIGSAPLPSLQALQMTMHEGRRDTRSGFFHHTVINSIAKFLRRISLHAQELQGGPSDSATLGAELGFPPITPGLHLRFSFIQLNLEDGLVTNALQDLRDVVSLAQKASGNALDVGVGAAKTSGPLERMPLRIDSTQSCLGGEWSPFSPVVCDARQTMEALEKQDEDEGARKFYVSLEH